MFIEMQIHNCRSESERDMWIIPWLEKVREGGNGGRGGGLASLKTWIFKESNVTVIVTKEVKMCIQSRILMYSSFHTAQFVVVYVSRK